MLFACLIIGGGWYVWSNLRNIEKALRESKFASETNLFPLVQEMVNLQGALQAFIINPSPANKEQLIFSSDVVFFQIHSYPDRLSAQGIGGESGTGERHRAGS